MLPVRLRGNAGSGHIMLLDATSGRPQGLSELAVVGLESTLR